MEPNQRITLVPGRSSARCIVERLGREPRNQKPWKHRCLGVRLMEVVMQRQPVGGRS